MANTSPSIWRFYDDFADGQSLKQGLRQYPYLFHADVNHLESVAALVTSNFHRCLKECPKGHHGDPTAGAVRLPVALEHLEDAEIMKISTRSGTRTGIEYNDLRCPHHLDNIPVEGRTYVRVDWDRIERNPYVDPAKEATVGTDNGVITRVDVRVVGQFTIEGGGVPISLVRSVVVTLETAWMNEEETYLDEFGLLRDDVEWKIADINYWAAMGCPRPPDLSELQLGDGS
ncbi:hypothetical protein YB2330_004793 [Saitoella coloradoensis]